MKRLAMAVGAVALLLALLAAGLWWWAGTEGSLAWTLERLARVQPLTAEGVQGSLRSGLKIKRLRWERDGLKVEATDLELAWQPLALMAGTVKLSHVRASALRIEDSRPPKPSVVPVSLVVPVRVAVDEAKVAQLQWVAAANSFEAFDIAGDYRFNGTAHQVKLTSIRWAGGRYAGQASVGAQGTLPVDARLEGRFEAPVPGSAKKLPLLFTATLRGPISDLQAHALLEGQAASPTSATHATASARITPWAALPVPQAQADFRQLDLGALWPQAPRTSLAGQLRLQPAGTATWALAADFSNAQPGPWDQQRLPIERLRAAGQWRLSGQGLVRQLELEVGGGQVRATGEWRGASGWVLQGQLANVNPAAIYSLMAPLALSGRADLQGQGEALSFDAALKAKGSVAKAGRRKQTEVSAALRALELRAATARGRWADGLLTLPLLELRTADALLRASGELRPASRAGGGRADLQAPGLQASVRGKLADNSGGGTLSVSAGDLGQALAWLARLPGVPALVHGTVAAGRGEAQLAWQGGWRDPAMQASLQLPVLDWRQDAEAAPWRVRDAVASLNGRLSDSQLQARGRAEQGQRRVALDLAARGGRRPQAPAVWQGQLAALKLSATDPALGAGPWSLDLRRAFELRWSDGNFEAGSGEALLTAPPAPQANRSGASAAPAVLAWEPVRWRTGELRTAGRLTGLPLAWIELFGGPQWAGSALSGDMVFDAQWDAHLGATPRLRASLVRSRGDLTVLAETAEGSSTRVRAGVRDARLSLASAGEAVSLQLHWDSERGGTADGQLATRLAPGGLAGWQWPDSAPLSGKLRAQLPRMGVWSLLAPPGWRLRGSLGTDINVAGTKADPQLTGTLGADDLALRSVVDGIELQGGRLRAHLEERRLLIDEFRLQGAGPAGTGGTLVATGEGAWTPQGPRLRMSAQLDRLRASIRPDRSITVSGAVSAQHDAGGTAVNGKLVVDQALILLPEEVTPRLGDDVVVRGAEAPLTRQQARLAEQAARPRARRLALAVEVDLGNNFRVRGQGIDTRLRGTVTVGGQSIAAPQLVGIIRASGGEYRAYGQRLTVERGELRFTGPIDNPALDLLAIRPNLVQRVGVQVTGRALNPYVRLYSEPDMPDAEKLSWLVTGRASPAGGAETALLQQAGLALLAGRSRGDKRGVAAALGLDELSFRRDGADGPSVTLGKRFGRDFYAAYERSLSGALGTLYIFYDLTRRVTVRAQAGERQAIDLIYTWSFD